MKAKEKKHEWERADHLICIMSSLGKLLRKIMWNMGNVVKLFWKKEKKGLTVKSRRASIPSLFLENVISLKYFKLFFFLSLILHFIFDLYLTPLVVVHWSPSPTLCTLDNRSSSGNLFLVSLYIEAKEIGRFFKIDVLLISILAATVRDIAIVRGGFWLFFKDPPGFKLWTFELQR